MSCEMVGCDELTGEYVNLPGDYRAFLCDYHARVYYDWYVASPWLDTLLELQVKLDVVNKQKHPNLYIQISKTIRHLRLAFYQAAAAWLRGLSETPTVDFDEPIPELPPGAEPSEDDSA